MRLESAKDLKAELLSDLLVESPILSGLTRARTRRVGTVRLRGVVERVSLDTGARTISSVHEVQRTVALGISPVGKDYRIAVRLQRQAHAMTSLVEQLRRRSAGEIDVRYVGRIEKRSPHVRSANSRSALAGSRASLPWFQRNTRPLTIGSSVGHIAVTAGTLGAFVTCNGKVALLSNNHVLANENRARSGDWILQRAHLDGGRQPSERVARLGKVVRLKTSEPNFADAALAYLEDGAEYYDSWLRNLVRERGRSLSGLSPTPVDAGDTVYKIGRTTGVTKGRITAFALDNVVVNFEIGNLRFDDQIEIEGLGAGPFSDGGDSGSMIVNSATEAVALLFAGSDRGGRNRRGLTFANPMSTVLDALKATLSY